MIFEEVRLTWKEREYVIAPDQVLRAIAKVEDVLTLGELSSGGAKGRLPLAKLAIAYGTVLRHAGAYVTDEEVYNGMFAGGGEDLARRAFGAIAVLQALMVPPEHLRAKSGDAKKPNGEGARAASSPSATSSS